MKERNFCNFVLVFVVVSLAGLADVARDQSIFASRHDRQADCDVK